MSTVTRVVHASLAAYLVAPGVDCWRVAEGGFGDWVATFETFEEALKWADQQATSRGGAWDSFGWLPVHNFPERYLNSQVIQSPAGSPK